MSFLDHYLKKHRLKKLSNKAKESLSKLESKLDKFVSNSKGPLTFEDCLKEYGTEIADLVERLSDYISNMPPLSLSGSLGLFRFIYSIAVEVYQIVEEMSDCVLDDSMSEQEKHDTKVKFGKELVYFIWMTVDPLKSRFNWVPFKKTIVKKLVFWLAGMALESVVDLFDASVTLTSERSASVMSLGKKRPSLIKAIP